MAKERLQKFIANCGHCSRRKAELLIEAGLVEVDGRKAELGYKIDPEKQTVTINGEEVRPNSRMVIALHKPAGFITSTHDTHDRLTVMDLLPRRIAQTGVLPAGRLDLETEGLLIMTNDGDLQHHITHPRYECEKEYYVELNQTPRREQIEHLERGIYLPDLDRKTSPADIFDFERRKDGTSTLKIRIREGMKRQIRRMFEALGMTVVYLKRLSVGGVLLDQLGRGDWRELTAEEVSSLEPETASPSSHMKKAKGTESDSAKESAAATPKRESRAKPRRDNRAPRPDSSRTGRNRRERKR